jgi:hypothetical protein
MAQAAPFYPEMTQFTLPLHALREELIALLLRWWISLVRGATYAMHRGAWATDPHSGVRQEVPDHVYTDGARALWADGVAMLAAGGTAVFDFGESH